MASPRDVLMSKARATERRESSAPAEKPAPPKGVTAADLIAREFSPPRFAIEGLLPEGLTVLGGRPKQGKSWLSLLIGWAVAGRYELDGRGGMPGSVLYLALEDTERRLQGRLRTLAGSLGWEAPGDLMLHTSWPRSPDGLMPLADWLSARKDEPFRLVIVDTLAKFRTPQKGNGNSYADDYAALGDLKQLLDQYAASGLVIHHTRKLRAEDPFDELSGTLGISGAADTLWILDRERGSDSARLYVTGRDVADATITMTWQKDGCRWIVGPSVDGIDTAGRESSPHVSKLEQCKTWLKEYLRVYAYPSAEIDEAGRAAGFAPTTVRDAKAALGAKGTREIVNKNYGGGQSNDWWSGLGPSDQWKRRPTLTETPRHRDTESLIPD